jgi:hypothetical protein
MVARTKLNNPPPTGHSLTAMPAAEFARRYHIHPTTVWRYLRDGKLEYVEVGHRKLVVPPPVQRATAPGA